MFLRWFKRIIARQLGLHYYELRAYFLLENVMSDTVSLNAGPTVQQTAIWTVTATDNGAPYSPSLTYTSDDSSVVGIARKDDNTGLVKGVPDPSGTGSKVANVTATIDPGQVGAGQSITKPVTVVTIGDTVLLTGDFSAPTP